MRGPGVVVGVRGGDQEWACAGAWREGEGSVLGEGTRCGVGVKGGDQEWE